MNTKIQNNVENNMRELLDLPLNHDQLKKQPEEYEILPALKEDKEKSDIQNDYEFARQNIRNLIETTQESLSTLRMVAEEAESARAFEVLADLTKQLVESNEKLLDLQLKYQKLEKEKDKDPNAPSQVTNVAFVGTSEQLQKLVNDRRKNK